MTDARVRIEPQDIPPELDRWNWGAFLLNWIWGVGNNTYIALLMFVPFVGLVMPFVLGAKGSRWAWRNGRWDSVEHFKRVQRLWAIWGVVILIGFLVLFGGVFGGIFYGFKHSAAYELGAEKLRASSVATNVLGTPITTGFPFGMRTVMEALKPLDDISRESVLSWIDNQFGRGAAGLAPRSDGGAISPQATVRREGTVSGVAQKLNAKSARDLLLAAAAHLTLYQGRDSFSKDDLVACAKDARNWKTAFSNQMALNIKRMLDAGTLFEKAKDVFSLSDAALSDIQRKLAQ